MLVNFLVGVVGVLIFLFIFWKRLKEDYSSEIIFKSASVIILGVLIGAKWFFWGPFAGSLLGLTFAVLRFRVRLYETLEALIISFLPWMSLVFLEDSVLNSSLSSFLAFLFSLIMLFIAYYFDVHYKNFTWYKSGKIGFAGLATLGLIFLVRSALATTGISVISFVSLRYEAIISGVAAFTCFLLLFNLGRTNEKR